MGLEKLSMMLADVMSRDVLVEKLKEAIDEYTLLKTDETYKSVEFYSHMIMVKSVVQVGGLEKAMEDMDRVSKASDLLLPNPR